MAILAIFLLVVLSKQTADCFQCQKKSEGYFETEKVFGWVRVPDSSLTLECKTGQIKNVTVRMVKPSKNRGSEIEKSVERETQGGTRVKLTFKVMPVARIIYWCSVQDRVISHHFVWLYGENTLRPLSKACPRPMRPLIIARDFGAQDPELKVNLQERCEGRRRCMVRERVARVEYTMDKDCRDRGSAYHCCDSDEAQDSDLSRATRACDVILMCDCCERVQNSHLNIKSCKSQPFYSNNNINIVGINYDEGIPYEESNDMDATDENPDRDEDGCHVRRAQLQTNSGKKEVCLPGNMARILSVVDSFSRTHGGKCNVKSNKNDESCRMDIDENVAYHFGVNVLLPHHLTSEWLTVEDFRKELSLKLEEEGVDPSFTIKGNDSYLRVNKNGNRYARFVLGISL